MMVDRGALHGDREQVRRDAAYCCRCDSRHVEQQKAGRWCWNCNDWAMPIPPSLLAELEQAERRHAELTWTCSACSEARERMQAAEDRAVQAKRERDETRMPVPTDEGGPGHEEAYWLRRKLQASIQHLRDVEDFYRLRGGLPEGHNMRRADRARDLYEAITEDFVNGKLTRPSRGELEAQLVVVQRERDEARTKWEADVRDALIRCNAVGVPALVEALRKIADNNLGTRPMENAPRYVRRATEREVARDALTEWEQAQGENP